LQNVATKDWAFNGQGITTIPFCEPPLPSIQVGANNDDIELGV